MTAPRRTITLPTLELHMHDGMHVNLADIMTAYIVVHGHRQPSDMSFVEAGRLVREARPSSWQALFLACQGERLEHPEDSYEALAERVRG